MTKQAAKKVSANLTSTVIPEKIVAPKPVKTAKVPVAKVPVEKIVKTPIVKTPKVKAEKPVKGPRVLHSAVAKPLLTLEGVERPDWVNGWIPSPKRAILPVNPLEKFSHMSIYVLVRELAPDYQDHTIDELIAMLKVHSAAHADTAVARWINGLTKDQLGDLKFRLEWIIVEALKRFDTTAASLKAAQELEAAKVVDSVPSQENSEQV